jgi:hypothetical protein
MSDQDINRNEQVPNFLVENLNPEDDHHQSQPDSDEFPLDHQDSSLYSRDRGNAIFTTEDFEIPVTRQRGATTSRPNPTQPQPARQPTPPTNMAKLHITPEPSPQFQSIGNQQELSPPLKFFLNHH